MNIGPPTSRELSEFYAADDALLHIRQRACADHALLHEDMSVLDVCAFQTKLSAAQQALRQWHATLPSHLHFPIYPDHEHQTSQTPLSAEHGGRRRLQYSYYETEELLLRPSLFILLHVRSAQNTQAMALDVSGSLDNVMSEHVASQLREASLRHRVSMLVRVRLCLDPSIGQPHLFEIGWLKRQTCATLALMLIASERVSRISNAPRGPGADETSLVAVIDMIEEFLSQDKLCSDVSKVYLGLLRKIRRQPGFAL